MMKLVRFATEEHPHGVYGVIDDGGSIEIIKGGLFEPVELTGDTINERDMLRYLPPVDPPNLLAIGLNYAEHTAEAREEMPSEPLLFIKATTTVVGHKDNIVLPEIAPNGVDYEAELCVIIGRRARNVSEEDAMGYIFGYTCGNDVSARDCQLGDGQWARGKSFDTFAPLGPYVVTDFDPNNRAIRMRLNGEVMQDARTSDMVFGVSRVVSYLSHCMTLVPGTVIMTGTPSGVGFTRQPPVYLQPGDVCEVEIEGIGSLRNVVSAK